MCQPKTLETNRWPTVRRPPAIACRRLENRRRGELLELDGGTCLLELRLGLLGLLLVDALDDGLGGAVDEVLSFLEPQGGELTDDLDDLDLLLSLIHISEPTRLGM